MEDSRPLSSHATHTTTLLLLSTWAMLLCSSFLLQTTFSPRETQIKVRCSFNPSLVSCVKPTRMAEASFFSFSQDEITHQVARAFTQMPSSSGTVHSAMVGISNTPGPNATTNSRHREDGPAHFSSASGARAHLAWASGRPCSTPSAFVPQAPGHTVSYPQHPAG